MWFSDRYTFSRGRSEVPMTFLRMRSCTRRRVTFFDVSVSISDPSTSLGMIVADSDARQTRSLRSRLSNLLLQALASIAHTFVLIRIGWTQRAHLGGNLPDLLAVNARNRELRLLRIYGDFNSSGQRILDRMRISQREHDRALALHLGAIADADDFQFARPPFGDAFDRVVDKRAGQSVQRRLRIVFAQRDKMAVLLFNLDSARHHSVQLALRSLYRDRVAFNFDRHALRQCDRLFSNSRHKR